MDGKTTSFQLTKIFTCVNKKLKNVNGVVQRFSYNSFHTPHQISGTNVFTIVYSENLHRNSPIYAASRLDLVKFSVSAGSCQLLRTYSIGYNFLTGRISRVLLDNLFSVPLILLSIFPLISSVTTPILHIDLDVLSECTNATSFTCMND